MQTNDGGEFCDFIPFFRTSVIEHRISCPYTSQLNDIVERKHRHLIDMGFTLLSQVYLPLDLWDDVFPTQFI